MLRGIEETIPQAHVESGKQEQEQIRGENPEFHHGHVEMLVMR